jgi:hypothetical protein
MKYTISAYKKQFVVAVVVRARCLRGWQVQLFGVMHAPLGMFGDVFGRVRRAMLTSDEQKHNEETD